MKMMLKLAGGYRTVVEVPEGTDEVAGVILSGHEVLVYPVFRDPGWIYRVTDVYEGHFHRKKVGRRWVDVIEKEVEQ